MRTARAILVYTLAVVVIGALLAPWLYWLVQWLALTFSWAEWLGHYPFKRIFNRSLMIVALLGLWPLLRSLGVRSWSSVGYGGPRSWPAQLLAGYGLGIVSVGLAVGLSHWLGHCEFGRVFAMPELVALVLKLMLTGWVVACLEETFFRGGLQQALARGLGWLWALVIASVIYSALHFLRPKGVRIEPAEVNLLSGYTCLGMIAVKSYVREGALTGFISLFLAGGILGWAYYRTGWLYFSIGLHAGWVLVNELVRKHKAGAIIEDWVTWPCLVILWLVVDWLIRRNRESWVRQ